MEKTMRMHEDRMQDPQAIRTQQPMMKRMIDVCTGEVKTGGMEIVLRSNAIASCVVVAAYDQRKNVGALAHIMVPGIAPAGEDVQRTKYAADAIEEMMKRMTELGATGDTIKVCLVGGGNVLMREDDTICQDNITSVIGILNDRRIHIAAQALGGTERRSVTLDVEHGRIHFTEGDGKENILWSAEVEPDLKEDENEGGWKHG